MTRRIPPPGDADLMRVATALTTEHPSDPQRPDRCGNPTCGDPYPCPAVRVAAHARRHATAPWLQRWTTRHDVASIIAAYQQPPTDRPRNEHKPSITSTAPRTEKHRV